MVFGRKLKTVIIISIVLTIIISTVASGEYNYNYWDSKEKTLIVKEYTFSEEDSNIISDFNVKWVRGKVKVFKSDTKQIKIIEKGFKIPKSEDIFTYKLNEGKLKIVDNNSITSLSVSGDETDFQQAVEKYHQTELDLEIFLPDKKYNSFVYDTVSSSFILSNLNIKQIIGETVNGNLSLENLKINDLNADTINGSIILDNTTVDEDFELKAINGTIDVKYNKIPENLKASVINGNISLTIPDNNGFILQKSNIKFSKPVSDFDLKTIGKNYIYKNGETNLNLSTVNGNISISKSL